ncbi:nitroreductase [Mycobacterium sp. GA-2829]|nr:nitroreductase family protein [Mycobacterium sp. GA-2829]KUI29357.1 nitroreductase [Mycobacterium sp. GA-2829]
MSLQEAIETQRAIRRLHPDPVDDALLQRLLELAVKAPNGGNEQKAAFVVVTDAAVRAQLARLNRTGFPLMSLYYRRRNRSDTAWARTWKAIEWQRDHFADIPVVIVVCWSGRIWRRPVMLNSAPYASVYPATQNLLLAARAVGLGAGFISLPLWRVRKLRRILGMPRSVTPVGVIPLGWPRGKYGPSTRRPIGEIAHIDRWGNRPWQ